MCEGQAGEPLHIRGRARLEDRAQERLVSRVEAEYRELARPAELLAPEVIAPQEGEGSAARLVSRMSG
jgi:hypothetical protein